MVVPVLVAVGACIPVLSRTTFLRTLSAREEGALVRFQVLELTTVQEARAHRRRNHPAPNLRPDFQEPWRFRARVKSCDLPCSSPSWVAYPSLP